ncbi:MULTISPECIES: helix-turn-helix domain-containing protein [Pseudomonas]|uniref:Transcriptional regulator n=1 Tax=Pseudomonas marincola TaxID=437900 RepID=A0A1I7A388_9PSED|nr:MULTISPECIES: helix-turn-helix transcriptional regulator [Pseudomonas]MBQ53817.1 XRE family transcriptional regulator [Pseudomonadaceae bacterium]HCP57490.1 XRE family transcriptional regulator [Pseudomonas sp.]OEO25741.1 transcriptional regulator [Pseudomonas sp. J237]CAE6952070.1 Helix-turn-helix [Pseudomonas marincola]SFT69408.1 Helix-turn-helix [Pseudomonas marincola]|tara:strand:+ start:317 stop:550 length:234 start_codon:yes stop_codon:yes gene_type:complete
MDKLAKVLGERIRTQRKIRHMSQDVLALACSIDRSYMGRIERGEVNITIEKLYRIAGELACDPYCLLPPVSELQSPD